MNEHQLLGLKAKLVLVSECGELKNLYVKQRIASDAGQTNWIQNPNAELIRVMLVDSQEQLGVCRVTKHFATVIPVGKADCHE